MCFSILAVLLNTVNIAFLLFLPCAILVLKVTRLFKFVRNLKPPSSPCAANQLISRLVYPFLPRPRNGSFDEDHNRRESLSAAAENVGLS